MRARYAPSGGWLGQVWPLLWILTSLLGLAGCAETPPPPLRVSVVGDVLLARGVPAAFGRDSAALRRTTRALWASSRYVVGNLECPLTDTARPVVKPIVFRGRPEHARWLRRLGFTHLSLANNHSLDQHAAGLRATARAVRAAGLGGIGFAADSGAGCQPQVLGADSSAVVFAYSALRQPVPGEGCLCGRDFAALCERVAAYKTLFPGRAVIVYLHWGTEYAAEPSPGQRRQARTLIDCGAAAVVGAHPHVVQSAEFYRGRPILYSLGNFLFDQRGRGGDLALQADFDLKAGQVVATWVRPLHLRGALPRPAPAAVAATIAARLRGAHPALQLVADPTGRGWQLRPLARSVPTATEAGYFARQLTVPLPTGRAAVGLRYRPAARQYQVRTTTDSGATILDLGFPMYQFAQADVDNDGQPDLLVGPEKATRFDSATRRRLFVYRWEQGRWRPRWLGSRVAYRLLYFRAARPVAGRTAVYTLEQTPDGRYGIGRYYWQGFGLALENFTFQSRSLDAAYLHFVRYE
ncbi:CapA family protein [Hymenobacter aquaticus]|uniref:CapA family protein n=1 Tax=Hymenobacter aquaticus TaxID=1867101 RepID=A0A4Z0Q8F6_9BACT|nr:CapA family protein [Hymenobacter aquaticus]TGE25689.1 CapA family protein [Hymenobacter aquaticus]